MLQFKFSSIIESKINTYLLRLKEDVNGNDNIIVSKIFKDTNSSGISIYSFYLSILSTSTSSSIFDINLENMETKFELLGDTYNDIR